MNLSSIPQKRKWLQIGLKHILLATLLAATWVAYYSNQAKIDVLSPRYDQLRKMARELIIRDPSRIAVIALEYNLDVSHSWRVFIPNDGFELCMATRGIGTQGLSGDFVKVPLPVGNYELGLSEDEIDRVFILKDGSPFLEKVETPGWVESSNSSSSGHGNISTQYDGKTPIELLRKQYMVPSPGAPGIPPQSWISPTAPANGVQVWIQKAQQSATK